MKVLAFTDGACSGNPGPGGWAYAALLDAGKTIDIVERAGNERATTNNRMEMMAVLELLRDFGRRIDEIETLSLWLDSSYVMQGATAWIWGWRKRDWIKADGVEVSNRDLWEAFIPALAPWKGKLDWNLLPGHRKIAGNERVDELSVAQSKGARAHNFKGSFLGYEGGAFEDYDGWELFLPALKAQTADAKAQPKKKKGSKEKALFYLSVVGGELMKHDDWASCERRVKGTSGARFSKVVKPGDEAELLTKWGISAASKKSGTR